MTDVADLTLSEAIDLCERAGYDPDVLVPLFLDGRRDLPDLFVGL